MAYMPKIKVRAFELISGLTEGTPVNYEEIGGNKARIKVACALDKHTIMQLISANRRNDKVVCLAHDTVNGNWHDEYSTQDAISRLYTGFIDTVVFMGQTSEHDIITLMEVV